MNKWLSVIWVFFVMSCHVYASSEAIAGAKRDTEGFFGKDNPLLGGLVHKNFKGEAQRLEDKELSASTGLIGFGLDTVEDEEAMAVALEQLNFIDKRYDIEIYQDKSKAPAVFSICFWILNEPVPFCYSNFLIRFTEQQSLELIDKLRAATASRTRKKNNS